MGACFSKRGKASSPTEVDSNVPLKNSSTVTGEENKPEPAEKSPAVTVTNNSSITEEKDTKEENTKAPVTGTRPLRTSSCTKEEVDAILIQCGRLSRNSSGKASNERKEEGGELEKLESRPSPSRRTPRRERSGSRERANGGGRRVSRSPGRRTDGGASPASTNDKPRQQQQQPAKMISVPATEKWNPGIEGASLAGERVSNAQSSRSRLTADNSAVVMNKSDETQSLSQSSSTKAGQSQSPYRRDPMTEIEENKINGGITSMFQKSVELDKGTSKSIQQPNIHKPEKAEESIGEVENLKQKTAQRTSSKSSRKSSHDFDSNQESNLIAYAAFLLEDIQKRKNQEQNSVYSFPSCVSKACSVLETVSDHNSSSSDQRNHDGSLNCELAANRELLVQRTIIRDEEPQESAGSNSFDGGNPLELLNSVDSSKEVVVGDKVVVLETQQQRSRASFNGSSSVDTGIKASTTAMRKKKLNHSPLQEARQGVGEENGVFGRKPISLMTVSSSTRRSLGG